MTKREKIKQVQEALQSAFGFTPSASEIVIFEGLHYPNWCRFGLLYSSNIYAIDGKTMTIKYRGILSDDHQNASDKQTITLRY